MGQGSRGTAACAEKTADCGCTKKVKIRINAKGETPIGTVGGRGTSVRMSASGWLGRRSERELEWRESREGEN